MLSGETAVGRHPLEVVETMGRIAATTERNLDPGHRLRRRRDLGHPFTDQDAIAHAAAMMAYDLKARAILCRSSYGTTPQRIATYRPCCPILAVSPHETVLRRLSLSFGIVPVHLPEQKEEGDLGRLLPPVVAKTGIFRSGDKVIGCSGISYYLPGSSNRLRILEV
jgi:pyruvate kinase